ncbi:acetaldehyde dehydrogenase [Thelephora terrestris]|uniref:Acetaldehyde dehydrogenase n=1 Tax=Thelephora terrestris TaxID=56493 RepID=A0A9P6H5B6_9AGAM|nr:acetaldehyde dehydrogenase [Thelephora terrestris]
MSCWKIGPALATGNAIAMKASEDSSSWLPACAFNLVVGDGSTVGQTISEQMCIEKVAFTGSTVTSRKIMEGIAESDLKNVTLGLGGKSPNIDQASGIYKELLERFTNDVNQGPQGSQLQFDRTMSYIKSGKEQGANVHLGGGRVGDKGYYVEPMIFTETKREMRIVREGVFRPVAVVVELEDADDAVRQANDTLYRRVCSDSLLPIYPPFAFAGLASARKRRGRKDFEGSTAIRQFCSLQ